MKKTLVIALLGIGAVTAAHAQGGIEIGNYKAPFNKVVWGPGTAGAVGAGVPSTAGVSLQLFFGEGVLTPTQLTDSVPMPWNLAPEGNGYLGYYIRTVTLPTWVAGDVFSFQVRASGAGVIGQSVVWQEQANIRFVGGTPAGLPGISTESIGLTVVPVPEPSTFALAGLGAAALLIFRRRA
jgi:hypothetical protein